MNCVSKDRTITDLGDDLKPMFLSANDLYTCSKCGAVYVREDGEDIDCNCDERLGEYLCLD